MQGILHMQLGTTKNHLLGLNPDRPEGDQIPKKLGRDGLGSAVSTFIFWRETEKSRGQFQKSPIFNPDGQDDLGSTISTKIGDWEAFKIPIPILTRNGIW